MKLGYFAVLGAISAIALAACVVEETSSGGADNGSGGSVGSGGSGGGGVGGGGGSGGSGGAAACDDTIGCADAITIAGTDPDTLCDASLTLYKDYADCVCTAGCETECGATSQCTSGGAAPDQACTDCIQKTTCATEFMDCSNDT
jgi:hypothetical protein